MLNYKQPHQNCCIQYVLFSLLEIHVIPNNFECNDLLMNIMLDKEDVDEDDEEGDVESTASGSSGGPDFNYILNNPLWCLTKEKKDALLKQRDEKVSEQKV